MCNKLYFICPTDNLESIINSTFNYKNYYLTSLANSFTFNIEFKKEICSIIESRKINDITFILSDNNKFLTDALGDRNFEKIRGLNSFYHSISKHKDFITKVWSLSDIQQILTYYLLNLKKKGI